MKDKQETQLKISVPVTVEFLQSDRKEIEEKLGSKSPDLGDKMTELETLNQETLMNDQKSNQRTSLL